MSADFYLGIFLFVAGGLLWLGSRGGGPPSKTSGTFGLLVALLLAGCSSPSGTPFVPPDVGQTVPDVGVDRECYEYDMRFEDYIVGVPSVVRIQYRWNYNWCVVVKSDYLGFEGAWFFLDWETTFSNWDQINQIILLVDGRPLAWVTGDRETGFDPTYDVGPYLRFAENKQATAAEGHKTQICLPLTVDLDAYTSTKRLDFEYAVTARVCPDPQWYEESR